MEPTADPSTLKTAVATGSPEVILELARSAEPLEPVWEHSEDPLEQGLEIAISYLALSSDTRREVIAVVHEMAQRAFPIAVERAGDGARPFLATTPHDPMDGAPVEVQIQRVGAWLEAPSEQSLIAVDESVDPARQLNIWDDDLKPQSPADMWMWLMEVGQLLAMACGGSDTWGDGRREEAEAWPWNVLAARAAVCCLKAARTHGDPADDLRAITSAPGP